MKRILSAKEMKEADMAAIEAGIPALVLMERAALTTVDEILKRELDLSSVFILCGPGNNGGDGVAIARIIAEQGYVPSVMIVGNHDKYTEQLKTQIKAAGLYKIRYVEDFEQDRYTIVIDSLFGIGLKRDITGAFAELINKINDDKAYKVAVDISSGINSTSGALMGTAFKADMTIAFENAKIGHYLYPGAAYNGEVIVKHIGIPINETKNDAVYMIEDEDLLLLPKRKEEGNKSTFGKVLIIAGSADICGAAYLSAAAALRGGAGMVRIFTHKNNRTALNVLLPEALIDVYDDNDLNEEGLIKAISWANTVVAGPGLGTGEISKKLLKIFIEHNRNYTVFDADALNIFASDEMLFEKISFEYCVTPHIGEMSRLSGKSISEIKQDPIEVAKEFSISKNTVCIMKDAKTVIAYPSGSCYINNSGCSALATAGSGDVLTGIIAAIQLKCRGIELPFEALAVYMHGKLGEAAAQSSCKSSVIASDLIKKISKFID